MLIDLPFALAAVPQAVRAAIAVIEIAAVLAATRWTLRTLWELTAGA